MLVVIFFRKRRNEHGGLESSGNHTSEGDIELNSTSISTNSNSTAAFKFTALPQEEEDDEDKDDTEGKVKIMKANFNDNHKTGGVSTTTLNSTPPSCWAILESLQAQFIPVFPLEEVFPQWSCKAFAHWGVFLELGMPGAFSLFLEWGSYELMAMISGRLGTVALATHGVYMMTCSIIYMVPLAISDATAVIAGNYLGNGDSKEARSVISLGLWYDMTIGLLAAVLLLFVLRPYWGGFYTSDKEVQREVYEKMPIMFVYITVDSMKCITLNVLRSTGRPHITMMGNIVCCVCIMLPLGWYLAITLHFGLFGVWGAMSVGWSVATLVYAVILYHTDWEVQAKEAARRNAIDNLKSAGTSSAAGVEEEEQEDDDDYVVVKNDNSSDCATDASTVDDEREEIDL